MTWWKPENFAARKPALLMRAQLVRALRRYFDERDFVEVQTPVLQACPAMDAHIHGFATQRWGLDRVPQETLYLQTSPEFSMKKLLVAGMDNIYQICPVFRNAEGSARHTPEFTMLEWYRSGSDYTALMDDCEAIVQMLAQELGVNVLCYDGKECDPCELFERLSVAQAFEQYAGIALCDVLDDRDGLAAAAQEIGIRVIESDQWDDIFHAVMAEKIEPFLGQGRACILYDYPVSMASLARVSALDPRFAERFELYVCGLELANAFSELTDPIEQRRRFEDEMKLKEQYYGYSYPLEEDFLSAIEHGLPESAGIALGVDRLAMLFSRSRIIQQVQWG